MPLESLHQISKQHLPVEILVAGYLANPGDSDVSAALFFSAMEKVLLSNYYESFVDFAITLQRRFSNFNRTVYDDCVVDFDPFANFARIPWLKWITEPCIVNRDMRLLRQHYSLERIIEIYEDFQKRDIFASKDKSEDMVHLGKLIAGKHFAKIVEEDLVPDTKRGAVLSDRKFRDLINPLIISYMYRLQRTGGCAALQCYRL